MFSRKVTRSIVVGVAAVAVAGGSYGIVSATSSSGSASASTGSAASSGSGAAPASGGGGSNARSGPAAGGAAGTVGTVSASSFTITTSTGQKVTIKEASSTAYDQGTSSTSTTASAVTAGEPVLILGTANGTTITATQVIVQPASSGSTASSAAQVVPFQRGAPTTTKQVGTIPAGFTQGSGTIVSGTAANQATEAALAAYPGAVVDRVVLLSNGDYNVHYIGVNWPHHVFLNQSFQVIGAE